MYIRYRTVAGTVASAGLAAAAVVHAAWAVGSTWPADTAESLADLVVGRQPPPSPAMCAGVTALLVGATAAVAVDSARRRPPTTTAARLIHRTARAVAVVLSVRGVGGVVTSGLGIGRSTPQYRKWDALLYSPLCLALAGSTFAGTGRVDG